jgi:hypothetical protein
VTDGTYKIHLDYPGDLQMFALIEVLVAIYCHQRRRLCGQTSICAGAVWAGSVSVQLRANFTGRMGAVASVEAGASDPALEDMPHRLVGEIDHLAMLI